MGGWNGALQPGSMRTAFPSPLCSVQVGVSWSLPTGKLRSANSTEQRAAGVTRPFAPDKLRPTAFRAVFLPLASALPHRPRMAARERASAGPRIASPPHSPSGLPIGCSPHGGRSLDWTGPNRLSPQGTRGRRALSEPFSLIGQI